MRLSAADTQVVFLAALLHDVGKIGFSDVLLAKPVNALAGEHLVQFRKHPTRSAQAITALAELAPAAAIVRAHHERLDGSGFPDGLVGEAIPLGARILAVADDYDGLQTGVLAQPALAAAAAAAAIAKASGRRYDPAAVSALFAALAGTQADAAGETSVTSAHLEPGMVLARDAVAADGALLLAADYVLDERLIRQLRHYEQTEAMKLTFHIKTQAN
jgi:response regulator RpfG family c-di-GMP phosphodiesterase